MYRTYVRLCDNSQEIYRRTNCSLIKIMVLRAGLITLHRCLYDKRNIAIYTYSGCYTIEHGPVDCVHWLCSVKMFPRAKVMLDGVSARLVSVSNFW